MARRATPVAAHVRKVSTSFLSPLVMIRSHRFLALFPVIGLSLAVVLCLGVGPHEGRAQESAPELAGTSSEPLDSAVEHLRLGIDFYLTNELDVAIDEFREAARLRPGYADAHDNLGVALAKRGDLGGAIAAWSRAERLDPSKRPTHYHLSALVAYNYGISLLRRDRLDAAMDEWRKAVRIQPDFPEAHYALGLGWLSLGDAQRAESAFQLAVSSAPDWAAAHHQLGLAYYEQRNFEAAEREWQAAIVLTPDFAEAYANLGLMRMVQGEVSTAKDALRRALDLNPTLAPAQFNWAMALVMEGRVREAIAPLETVRRLAPAFTPAPVLLGWAWSTFGDWAKAVREWRAALGTSPSPEDIALIHYNLGVALFQMGEMRGAVEAFRLAVEHRPRWAEAFYRLGVTLAALKAYDEAVSAYERSLELQPGWAHVHFNLGNALYRRGSVPEAIQAYEKAVQLDPEFADAQYRLGVTLRALGRATEAVEPLAAAADGGLLEAQILLAAMYANGSGVSRDLPQAMLWWFRAASTESRAGSAEEARAQLSFLRRKLFLGEGAPEEIEAIRQGFDRIRQTLLHDSTRADGAAPGKRPGHGAAGRDSGRGDVPLLIREALALDPMAQRELEGRYFQGFDGESGARDSRILEYFVGTALEHNPQSCRVLEGIIARRLAEPSAPIDRALRLCRG